MTTLRLHISYDGTEYHGWQRQPGIRTVEGEILRSVATLLDVAESEVELQGASRTDAGVHARGQVANVVFSQERSPWDFVRALNSMTADDISVNHAEVIRDDFNARFDSRGKWYQYTIWNHRFAHPWFHRLHWTFGPELDAAAMQKGAQHLVGEHDFSSFRASDCQASSVVREIFEICVRRDTHFVEISIHGSAFLKNMVRIIVGTLSEVGLGKPEAWVGDVLRAKDRTKAGRTAPASGLTLQEVLYPDDPWKGHPEIGGWDLIPNREQ